MDNQGNIITLQGYQVLPGITIPANASKPTISYDGQVSVEINGIVTALGRIELAKFTNTPGLQPIGDTMYTSTSASGDPITGAPTEDGFGRIRQFFLENSNVNAITEMSNLIKAQRAFEFNSKVMHTSDAISQNIVQALA
jgi:flagellar basal-body rod protein FlgG